MDVDKTQKELEAVKISEDLIDICIARYKPENPQP